MMTPAEAEKERQRLVEMVVIKCRCKDCEHCHQRKDKYYCYFWDFETGMEPNQVNPEDFCSNAEPDLDIDYGEDDDDEEGD